jgi:hypothetical protein
MSFFLNNIADVAKYLINSKEHKADVKCKISLEQIDG